MESFFAHGALARKLMPGQGPGMTRRWVALPSLAASLILGGVACHRSSPSGSPNASSSSASAAAPSLLFQKTPLSEGTIEHVTREYRQEIDWTFPQARHDEIRDRTAYTDTWLATTGTLVHKVSIRYEEHARDISRAGAVESHRDPVAGKSFVANFDRKGFALYTPEGGQPLPEEFVAAHDDLRWLGKRDVFLSALPLLPLSVGEEVEPLQRQIEYELFDLDTRAVYDESALKLKRLEEVGGEPVGLFDVRFRVRYSSGGVNVTLSLQGSMVVRAKDSRFLSATLSGKESLEGVMTGTGQVTFQTTHSYTQGPPPPSAPPAPSLSASDTVPSPSAPPGSSVVPGPFARHG